VPPTQSFGKEVGGHLRGAIDSAKDVQGNLNEQTSQTEEAFKQMQQQGQSAQQPEEGH
jgi:hypothetical protein